MSDAVYRSKRVTKIVLPHPVGPAMIQVKIFSIMCPSRRVNPYNLMYSFI